MKKLIETELTVFDKTIKEKTDFYHTNGDMILLAGNNKDVSIIRDFHRQSLTSVIIATAERFRDITEQIEEQEFHLGFQDASQMILNKIDEIKSELNGEDNQNAFDEMMGNPLEKLDKLNSPTAE